VELKADTNISEKHTVIIFRAAQYVSQKCLYLPTIPNDVTTQKTNINTFTAERTLDVIKYIQ
jgi:hypothetical protein